MADVLQLFSPPVRAWFAGAFPAPSPPQALSWPVIARGEHTLITAPTGSGKTLAAFLWCIDRLGALPPEQAAAPPGIHTLYVSPLKALSVDLECNLRAPLAGVREAARRLGGPPFPHLRVAVRTGDTPAGQRSAMLRRPPHVLLPTPESRFLLLTSPRARPLLAGPRYLIVDEIHALLGNKRGASLALSLERLSRLCHPPPVRVGLSATVHPLAEAARFLGGLEQTAAGPHPRPVRVVDAGMRKALSLQVQAPVADFGDLPQGSVWPRVHALLLEQVRSRRSTLVFVRMRAQAERVSRALNELAGEPLARPHHISLSGAARAEVEQLLRGGQLPAIVSTGTLELGIDVGTIDRVVQLGSPGSVSAGLQRVGRAGHLLGASSEGALVPLHREDLV